MRGASRPWNIRLSAGSQTQELSVPPPPPAYRGSRDRGGGEDADRHSPSAGARTRPGSLGHACTTLDTIHDGILLLQKGALMALNASAEFHKYPAPSWTTKAHQSPLPPPPSPGRALVPGGKAGQKPWDLLAPSSCRHCPQASGSRQPHHPRPPTLHHQDRSRGEGLPS